MSLYIDFEPHSLYMDFAIKKGIYGDDGEKYTAYTVNGMTGFLVTLGAMTLKELKQQIKQYRVNERKRKERLYKELEQKSRQVTTNYKNWLIAINRTGNNTVVQAYSKTVPVKQVTADTIDNIKLLIDEEQ